jgi:hypothetical protein
MIADPIELEELLETTKDLIAHNKWAITFTRGGWERVPGGGQRAADPQEIDSQDVYFGAVMIDASYTVTWEGNQVKADYVIVGLPDLDVSEKDEFTVLGRDFAVAEIHPDRQYETRAWCIERK